jgi:hypothetical protein
MRIGVSIIAALFVSATAVEAQEWPRFTLFGGAQVADFGTDIRLDATATIRGSTIDFERDLGLNETAAVASATAIWRISRRNQFQMFVSRANRDAVERRLQRDIRFGESTFNLNADVDAFLNTRFVGGSYRFAIVATPTVEVGPLIGLAAIRLSSGIALSGSVSGQQGGVSGSTDRREASFTAPAVLPGAFMNLRAHPRLTIRASGGYLSADFGDFNGQLVQAKAGADFMFTRWLGVGGNYSYQRMSVGVDKDNFGGDVRYSFGGPQIYAVVEF